MPINSRVHQATEHFCSARQSGSINILQDEPCPLKKRDRVALPLTLVLSPDFLCAFFLARELPTKGMEKEEGTKTPNTSSTKAPTFHVLSEHSSKTTEKSIATVLYEACNFKHSVNNVAITFSSAAQF